MQLQMETNADLTLYPVMIIFPETNTSSVHFGFTTR